MLKTAIIGLPNAGNQLFLMGLIGRKAVVVINTTGVTRDRREGIGRISDLRL